MLYFNNGKDHLGKFDSKADEGILLRYNSNSASYRVFNKRTLIVESSFHVTFDESNLSKAENGSASDVDRITTDLEDLDLLKDDEAAPKPIIVDQDALEAAEELPKERRWTKHHPTSNIIRNLDQGVTTRGLYFLDNLTFVSLIEPKSIVKALQDDSWILTMQDELN